MTMLHRVGVSDGSLLGVVAGLESVARRFDTIVDRYVPGASTGNQTDDARTLDLLLGLVAVRERLRNVLENATAGAEDAIATPPRAEESWLR